MRGMGNDITKSYVGMDIKLLCRVETPFRGGQGRSPHGFACVYVEKTYAIRGKLDLEPGSAYVKSLDMASCQMCLLEETTPSKARDFPDPPCVQVVGGVKWIAVEDVDMCLTHPHRIFAMQVKK